MFLVYFQKQGKDQHPHMRLQKNSLFNIFVCLSYEELSLQPCIHFQIVRAQHKKCKFILIQISFPTKILEQLKRISMQF